MFIVFSDEEECCYEKFETVKEMDDFFNENIANSSFHLNAFLPDFFKKNYEQMKNILLKKDFEINSDSFLICAVCEETFFSYKKIIFCTVEKDFFDFCIGVFLRFLEFEFTSLKIFSRNASFIPPNYFNEMVLKMSSFLPLNSVCYLILSQRFNLKNNFQDQNFLRILKLKKIFSVLC